MAIKKGGLGRGLDALLTHPVANKKNTTINSLPIDLLGPGKYQPRTDFNTETLQELADSIAAQGLIQPIVVRLQGNNNYEILAGERRWRAAQLAGMQDVPVVVKNVDDRAAMAISLVENIQREDLNAIDESEALQRLIEEFELTHQQAADAVGRSRVAVSNILRLLDLSEGVRDMLRAGDLDMGHGRALLGLASKHQHGAADKVVKRGLSVRATESMVKQLLKEKSSQQRSASRDPDIERLEQSLAEQLGAKVEMKHANNGAGKITIAYSSLDELDGILAHLK